MWNRMGARLSALAGWVLEQACKLARLAGLAAALVFPPLSQPAFATECAGKDGASVIAVAVLYKAAAASEHPLVTLFRGEKAWHAIILIFGIYNDHHYFQPRWKCFAGEKYCCWDGSAPIM